MQHRRQTGQRMARLQTSLPRPVHGQHLARFAHTISAAQRNRLARRTVVRALHNQPIAGHHPRSRLDAPILGVRAVHVRIGGRRQQILRATHLPQPDLGGDVPCLREDGENRYASSGEGGSRAIGDAVTLGNDARMARRDDVTPLGVDTWVRSGARGGKGGG